MSKLNAVRLININYNHNAIRISDEIMHFNGISTLVSLQNGGGKSVLVQMLIAPFVQKRYRNTKDRSFESYFTTPQPSFILVEWMLENQAGYLLTGMMVRRNQSDDGEKLEIINIVSEYKEACARDLHNLPVVEKDKRNISLKSFHQCKTILEAFKKENPRYFSYYDMNNSTQAKQYFAKLEEYGINYKEWQTVVKKINEEESGLSKLFIECRNEKELVEKWFLEAVENKLNKSQNRMEEFRNIAEKYISLYYQNTEKIKRRELLNQFAVYAEKLESQGDVYLDYFLQTKDAKKKLSAYFQELERLISVIKEELVEENQSLEYFAEELRSLNHQMYSLEYYGEEDYLKLLNVKIAEIETLLSALEESHREWERKNQLLQCALKQERVDSDSNDLSLIEQRLEICKKEGQELEPEREYLGYRLQVYYLDLLRDIHQNINMLADDLNEARAKLLRNKDSFNKLEQQRMQDSLLKGKLEAKLEAYDKQEHRYNKKWNASLERNLLGWYEPGLELLLKELQDKCDSRQKDIKQKTNALMNMRAEQETLEKRLEDLKLQQKDKEYQLSASKKMKEDFDKELSARLTFMQYLELPEARVYDKPRIEQLTKAKLAELEALISLNMQEQQELKAELERLQTGKTLKLPVELQSMLESLDIKITYGMEWLKRNGQTENYNLGLVKQIPFLPFALIMTHKELQRLQKADDKIYTSSPIPIVVRESLEINDDFALEAFPHIGNTHFYVYFNKNLLNEVRLKQILDDLASSLDRKHKELNRRKDEHKTYALKYEEIANQKVTEAGYNAVVHEIGNIEEIIAALKQEYIACKDRLVSHKKQILRTEEYIASLDKEAGLLKTQIEDLVELEKNYADFLVRSRELEECKERLTKADAKKQRLTREAETIDKNIHKLELESKDLEHKEIELKQSAVPYSHYKQVEAPDNFDLSFLADIEKIKARYLAITDTVSQELKALEAEKKRSADRLLKSKMELERYAKKHALQAEDWADIAYSVLAEEEAENELNSLAKQKREQEQLQNETLKNKALSEQKLSQILKDMQKECFATAPLAKVEILEQDFEASKKRIVFEQDRCRQKCKELDQCRQMLEQNATAVAEYGKDGRLTWKGEEDFRNFNKEELRDYTTALKRNHLEVSGTSSKARNKLEQILNKYVRIPEFQNDNCKHSLEMLLEVTDNPERFKQQLETILTANTNLISKLAADIAIVEQEKEHIVGALQDYIHEVHNQLGKIDKNSTITVRGKSVKMLKLGLPAWDNNEALYHVHVGDLLEDITQKSIALLAKNEAVHELIGKRLTTKELYNAVIGISNIQVQLFKIEAQRELQISWTEVAKNSGGEGFLSAFVILSSLLYYMRRDDTDIFADHNEGKVLIMDNPFAQTNAAHLLKPLMDVAKKNNTQLICLTGLSGDSIYNRFENIYVLNLVNASLNNVQYLKSKHLLGAKTDELLSARIEVKDEDELMESLF